MTFFLLPSTPKVALAFQFSSTIWAGETGALTVASSQRPPYFVPANSPYIRGLKVFQSALPANRERHVARALPSGLQFEVHVCMARPRSRVAC